jgi:hypothetical protein
MSSNMHTPGPWHIVPGVYDTNPETASEFPHGPEIIANFETIAWCQMYGEANARLIATAPKMLEFLKRLRCHSLSLQDVWKQARELINEAEGR